MNWSDYYKQNSEKYPGLDLTSRLRAIGKTQFGIPLNEIELKVLKSNIISLIGDVSECSHIIDLGCGTGIVAEAIISKYIGIQIDLVDPNRENIQKCRLLFEKIPNIEFHELLHDQALHLVGEQTTLLAYEVVQHIPHSDLVDFIRRLTNLGIKRVVLGGVPDIDSRESFYKGRSVRPQLSNSSDNIIGFWYNKSFFEELVDGRYKVSICSQGKLYTAHYRYDVIIERI